MAPDHDQLIARVMAGDRDPALLKRLVAALEDDAELRAELRDHAALERMARTLAWAPLNPDTVMEAIAAKRSATLEQQVMASISPRRRTHWRWAAAALLLIALGALTVVATLRDQPAPAVEVGDFARLRHVQNVRWASALTPADGARLRPGVLDLAGGVIEVVSDNAARVLIEGPARVELISAMRLRLHHGRLTTDIPPSAHGFTVVTPGAQVVDLGTEVGIEVGRDGQAHVQVFSGAVDLALDGRPAGSISGRIIAGMARRVDPGAGRIVETAFDPGRFLRPGAGHGLTLDAADLIAGGDGRGSATQDGIDPLEGALVTGPSRAGRAGGGTFHPLPGLPFIDGAFVPRAGEAATVITSTGLDYRFDLAGGGLYDLIRRGGFLIRPPDAGYKVMSRSPTVIDGVDHATIGHNLIGMHTNAGVTLDLHALAAHHGRRAVRFTTVVANTAPRHAAPAPATVRATFEQQISAIPWIPLSVRQATSAAGTRLTPESDGSLVASEPAPTDTYTVTCATSLRRLTALRLEVLPDPRLPRGGPGAYGNGNFILTRLRVALTGLGGRQELTPIGAVADFSQNGWPIAAAVTGKGPNGWAVVPETGRPHTAVFLLDHTTIPTDARIEVVLAQLSTEYDYHLIGRFRLSATDDPDPLRGLVVGAGSFLVLIDGQLAQRVVVPQAEQSPARIDIPLLPTQRFLTLVSSDGGYGNGMQWTTLGDPRLHLSEPVAPR